MPAFLVVRWSAERALVEPAAGYEHERGPVGERATLSDQVDGGA